MVVDLMDGKPIDEATPVKGANAVVQENYSIYWSMEPNGCLPVGDIAFKDIGVIDPKPDITPLESIRLTQMITQLLVLGMMVSYGNQPINFKKFVEDHGLARHFRKEHLH